MIFLKAKLKGQKGGKIKRTILLGSYVERRRKSIQK